MLSYILNLSFNREEKEKMSVKNKETPRADINKTNKKEISTGSNVQEKNSAPAAKVLERASNPYSSNNNKRGEELTDSDFDDDFGSNGYLSLAAKKKPSKASASTKSKQTMSNNVVNSQSKSEKSSSLLAKSVSSDDEFSFQDSSPEKVVTSKPMSAKERLEARLTNLDPSSTEKVVESSPVVSKVDTVVAKKTTPVATKPKKTTTTAKKPNILGGSSFLDFSSSDEEEELKHVSMAISRASLTNEGKIIVSKDIMEANVNTESNLLNNYNSHKIISEMVDTNKSSPAIDSNVRLTNKLKDEQIFLETSKVIQNKSVLPHMERGMDEVHKRSIFDFPV
jgi:hypothetical protein